MGVKEVNPAANGPSRVKLTADHVETGSTFAIRVTLEDFVEPGQRVFLRLAYHRLLRRDGDVALLPIDFGYIDPASFPSTIVIDHPHNAGDSRPVRVLPDPTQPAGSPPLTLPEDMLVTVFVESSPEKFCSQVIRVVRP